MSGNDDICVIPAPGEDSGIVDNVVETTVSHYDNSNNLTLNNALVNVVPNTYITTYTGTTSLSRDTYNNLLTFPNVPAGIYMVTATVGIAGGTLHGGWTDFVYFYLYNASSVNTRTLIGTVWPVSPTASFSGVNVCISGTIKTTVDNQSIILQANYLGLDSPYPIWSLSPNVTLQKIG